MSKYIPYGRQSVVQEDIDAVVSVLKSDFLTQGPQVTGFENLLKDKFNSKFSVVQNSATASLYIAYRALGITSGDIVWTVPNTFVSTANAALLAGAQVDFVDIDSDTYCMSVSKLEKKLDKAKRESCLPKVIAPVHFAGQPCDLKAIHDLSDKYGFKVLEDAAHAVGAIYRDQFVGSCAYSEATIFSFHPVKIITTGEGGAVLANDPQIAQSVRLLTSHGITRDHSLFEGKDKEPWVYEQIDVSHNFRMTDMQAALGTSQLKRLDENIKRRQVIASQYQSAFADLPLKYQKNIEGAKSSWHLFVIQTENSKERKALFHHLKSANIGVNVHYIPVHCQPYYKRLGFREDLCPESIKYYETCISIPMFHSLTDEDQNFVIEQIQLFYSDKRKL